MPPATDAAAPVENTIGAYNPKLSEQAWTHAHGQALKDSVAGRGFIRMFSRGIMGATAFTIGGWWASKRMWNYSLSKPLSTLNEVEWIARAYDTLAGTPIKAAVNLMGKDGEKFVNNFRPTMHYDGYSKAGRSLGHEVVMVTFDFGTMSIGDFWGRKIAQTLDPNKERPKWRRKDGSIDVDKAAKTFAKNWWTAITYAAGEDWAVAVPYCLTMHHVGTPIINKFVPGYRFEFDRNGNGGGLLVDDKGKITGNMTTAGVFNLWERFTTYNVGTLIYREAYNWIGGKLNHWWKTGKAPGIVEADPSNPNRTTLQAGIDGVRQFGNWITRSTVKALMYMIPAVPFFWITRTPQHKYRGQFMHAEKGAIMYGEGAGKHLHADVSFDAIKNEKRFFYSATGEVAPNPLLVNPLVEGKVDPHGKTWGWFDKFMAKIGRGADKVRGALREPISKAFGKVVGDKAALGAADTYISAAMAYTPYFWAKSDWLADRWDYGRMDAAVDRTIAGAVTLNPGEFKAGTGEVWQAIKRKPFKDPVREEYAQCLEATDATPSDNKFDVNPHAGQSCDYLLPNRKMKKPISEPKKDGLSWRERVVQAKPQDRPEVGANNPKGHGEREEMRKALEEMHPPTNSIN